MEKRFTGFLISLLIWPLFVTAQTKNADSLRSLLQERRQLDTTRVRLLNKLSKEIYVLKPAMADSLSREALQLAQRLGDLTGEVHSLMGRAQVAEKLGRFPQASDLYQRALKLAQQEKQNLELQFKVQTGMVNLLQSQDRYDEALRLLKQQYQFGQKIGNRRLLVENLSETADTYIAKGEYSFALDNALKALQVSQSVRDTLLIIQTSSNLGLLYTVLRDFDKSLNYQYKALTLARHSPYRKWECISLNRIGEAFLSQGKPRQAEGYFRKSLSVVQSLNERMTMANCEGDMADALGQTGRYKESLIHGYRSWAILKPTQNLSMNAWIQKILARSYLYSNQLDSAIHLGKASFELARQAGHKEYCRDASGLLAEAFSRKSDYESAFNYQKLHITYRDSLLNDETARRVSALNYKSELAIRRNQVALLQKDNQLRDVESKRQKLVSWALVAVVVLTVALVVVLVRTNQHKQQQTDQLLALDELKTRFFSNITHEFRTPLSLIILPAEQILRDNNLPGSVHRGLLAIHRNARQLLRLINELLDLAKLEAGSMRVTPQAGNPVEFIRQMVEHFRPAAEGKSIHLDYTGDPAQTEYLFDADKLEKIMYNLLSNALKFTPNGGSVQVSALIDASQRVHIQVCDTGIGIPADKLPHIFDRFYQVDDTRTRSYEGSGIGLALVKELTQLLEGTVSVKSEPGRGTRFELYLPVQPTGREAANLHTAVPVPSMLLDTNLGTNPVPAEVQVPAAVTGKPLVLVVEDNADLRELVAQTLSDTYQVLTASNGRQGWELARTELPDLIVSDIMMPDMDGYELCRRVKESAETSHIALVLLTARTSQESRIEGLTIGADDYLAKPFNSDELLLRIRNLLDRRQKLRDYFHQQLSTPAEMVTTEVDDVFLKKLYAILDHYLDSTGFGVEELASAAGISRRTLNRKLSTLADVSANDFIRRYRLKRAAELLRTGCAVAETAYRVGFDNPSYFTAVFKDVYKLTPSEFIAR